MADVLAIIDDSHELRRLLSLLLEGDLGVSCLGLSSLSDAQAHATEVLGSLAIVLDINLGPGAPDGVAVYRWLRDNDYGGSVFFFTGHAKDSPHVKEAAGTGVPILEKPMQLGEFVPILRRSIRDAHRLRREQEVS